MLEFDATCAVDLYFEVSTLARLLFSALLKMSSPYPSVSLAAASSFSLVASLRRNIATAAFSSLVSDFYKNKKE